MSVRLVRAGLNLFAVAALVGVLFAWLAGYETWSLPLAVLALILAALAEWLRRTSRPGLVMSVIALLMVFVCVVGALLTAVRW